MSQKDVALKDYLSIPEVFADLFNGFLFDGEEILNPLDLETMDSTETMVVKNKDNSVETLQKFRDVIKKSVLGAEFVILGAENQINVHYAMPVRSMLYDALGYLEQLSSIAKVHRDKKDLSGDEYLSKFAKTDRLTPIITIVVYYGSEDWDGSLDLYGLLDFPKEKINILKNFIPDYRINLLSVNKVDDIEKYKTGLRELFGIIKYKGKKLRKYVMENKDRFSNLDEATYNVIKVFINLDGYVFK